MKKLFASVLVCVLLALAASCACAAEYKDEYKVSVNIAMTTPQGIAVQRFADLVKERTEGKVNLKIYWNGQIFSGKATNELLMMRRNIADFSLSSFINWAPQFPAGNIFLLPWFIANNPDKYVALDAVEAGKAGKMLEEMIGKFNLHVLAWGEQGSREITNSVRPIRTPDDMKDIKIRVIGSPLFMDIFQALGANPMNIAFSELLTALQQNTIDGQENPYSVYIPNRIYEFQKYLTEWSYGMDPLIYCVHVDVWKTFPDDVKKIISDAAQECGLYNKALSRLTLDNGWAEKWLTEHNLMPTEPELATPRKYVQEKGVEVTLLTAEEIKAFRDKMNPIYEKWVSKIGEELVAAAEEDMKNAKY